MVDGCSDGVALLAKGPEQHIIMGTVSKLSEGESFGGVGTPGG